MTRGAAAALWLVIVVGGFGFAPPSRPDQWDWVVRLLTGRWEGESPWVVAQFQMMGLWPALVGLLVRGDWRARPIPAWPFALGAFAFGCYALLPWFVLRRGERNGAEPGPITGVVLPLALAASAAALAVGAVVLGGPAGPAAFARVFWTDGFVFPMTFDFLAFWLLSVAEARARARRTPWALTLVPLVGLGLFLALEARPISR
jgi:hypothetical protein